MTNEERTKLIEVISQREILRPLSRLARLIRKPIRTLPFYVLAALGHIKPFLISFKTLWGTKMTCYLPEGNTFFYYGYCEANLTNFLLRYIKQDSVCIDVGAHVGFYSMLLSKLVGPRGAVHSFEPTPLIEILEKKGIQNYTETVDENLVFTFFYKTKHISFAEQSSTIDSELGWDQVIKKFENKTEYIDVRELEMPLPMLTIIDKLESLNVDTALFVYHKRIPVFLLPELKEKKFNFLIKEIDNSEVHLLIFKE